MNKFKEAAIIVLKKANKPMHAKDIAAAAISSGILQTKGRTPAQTMKAQIAADIKIKGSSSNFVKVGRAIFAINESK